ncbi:hypothetical protein OIDMADRAFT_18102 [Oidiodendron maius Zn]|uniref:Uncharacterized protein n=1 Tax=Oidiodendron maius (strain Zn) TaxID=913774 RepID=A0A0C3DPD3_OIDMZ|nr:hypothetical protein OIDMADRAFT_18102 [Oidiodendron maius Zn]
MPSTSCSRTHWSRTLLNPTEHSPFSSQHASWRSQPCQAITMITHVTQVGKYFTQVFLFLPSSATIPQYSKTLDNPKSSNPQRSATEKQNAPRHHEAYTSHSVLRT